MTKKYLVLISLFYVAGDDAVADDYASIAMYFENQKQYFLAGKFFLKSAQYAKVGKVSGVFPAVITSSPGLARCVKMYPEVSVCVFSNTNGALSFPYRH